MKSSEVKRFAALYERHLKLLQLQGKSDSTISCNQRFTSPPKSTGYFPSFSAP